MDLDQFFFEIVLQTFGWKDRQEDKGSQSAHPQKCDILVKICRVWLYDVRFVVVLKHLVQKLLRNKSLQKISLKLNKVKQGTYTFVKCKFDINQKPFPVSRSM